MPNRIEKVNSLLQHEISKIIARDFTFSGSLVTLTRVETFANLIGAKAYISVIPSASAVGRTESAKGFGETKDSQIDHVVAVLNKGVSDVQQKINKMLNMRPIPKIMFVADKETAEAARVEELLEKLKKEEK